ncbi:hypothetical protein [Gilvimarinus chinensis]|uniref:hypothetical protein n=1 Tax=Gilvimarinus chinensis TaxID=396005 RepID=UPI00037434A4|nr:hypothetical protein [Gilvimarinus chinensis]
MSHEAYVEGSVLMSVVKKAGQIFQIYHSCKRNAANVSELHQCESTKETSIQADFLACEGTSSVWSW